MATGAAVLVVLSALVGESMQIPDRGETWAALAYLVVVGSVVVFGLYVFVLRHWSASRAAYLFAITPQYSPRTPLGVARRRANRRRPGARGTARARGRLRRRDPTPRTPRTHPPSRAGSLTRNRAGALALLAHLHGCLALEQDALAAVAATVTADDVERVRVEYLGRKSALKLALREVRDRDTGMALNSARERIERRRGVRRSARRAELDRRLAEDVFDVTLPGEEHVLGSLTRRR